MPSIGSYYADIRISGEDSILSSLHPLDSQTPGYLERAKEEQFLRSWDAEGLTRLKLSTLTIERNEITNKFDLGTTNQEETDPLDLIKRQ